MLDVITIGTVTVDTFIKADFLKTVTDKKHLEKIGFPTGQAQCFSFGSKIEIKEPIIEMGGGAHNSAVTFSRANLKTASLFNVGSDKNGDLIVEEFIKKGIDPLTIVDNGEKTGVSYILLDKSGERTILVFRGSSGDIEIKEIPFNKLNAKWAYIAPGSIPDSVLLKIFNYLKKNKIKIAVNPSKDMIAGGIKKCRPFLDKASVVIMNREEASYLTKTSFENKERLFKKLDEYVPGIVVMTDGKNGAIVSDGRFVYTCGIFKEKKVIDRTGAGDAFGSSFVAGLIETDEQCIRGICNPKKIEFALRRGAANATAVIEKIGATPGIITTEEFMSQKRWKNFIVKKN